MTDSSRLQPRMARLASLPDQLYDHLRRDIISGVLPPGVKLVELEIAAQMGTSQGPVREALQRLERDGLVERRVRSATFVTNISIDEMYELFSIRSVIETFAVRRAAQKVTPEQCRELDDLIEKMEESGALRVINTLAEYDMQFHQRIVEWSGSANFLRTWTTLSNQILRFIVQTHPAHYPDYVEIGTRHQPILDALCAHDADAAVQAMQEHIMLIWPKINSE